MSTAEKRHLLEAATLVGESAREDGAWKVRLISEGQGSSGFYSRELLEGFHSVLDDVLSFKNHPGEWEGPETRDFTMIVGEILGETWVEDDERGMAAVFGWYLPDPEYRDKIERYKNKIALSIYAMGEGEFNEDSGRFEVLSFEEDPYNSLDVVIAAGARGKFLEHARKVYAHRVENASATSAEDKDKEGLSEMAEKDVLDKLDTLIAHFAAATESKQKEAQAEVDSATVESAAKDAVKEYDARVEAISAAELLPAQAKALRESALLGKDISADLDTAVTIAKEAREEAAKAKAEGANHETGQFTEGAGSTHKLRGFGSKGGE